MDRLLIDVVLEQWKRQDESGVPRWAFFLCSKNKTPYYPKGHKFGNGHNSATTDEITAREMFGTATIKGSFIAVAGGELSGGVFVVDIDIKKEGTPELYKNPDNIESAIVNMFGDIPKTESQTTMSGGRHLLFYDKKINSLNDAFDVKSTGLSIDIKGNGGYFILYDDDINFENISDSPPWLLSHMNSRKTEQKESTADFSETLTEGNRNSGLTAIAGKFYNYGDSIDVLKSFLYGHNQLHCAPPLADKDVDRIIKSVIDNFSRDYEKTEFKNDENTENKSRFNLKNIHDIWRDRPPTKWIVDHLICEGSLSLIAADAGCGKTWASLDLASCIALGIPWLGMEVEQGNVLIIDEESGDDYLAKRFKQVITAHGGTEENTPAFYISMDRTSLVSINDLREIKKLIIENNINFIVIDAAMDVLPGVKENASDEVAPPLNSLKKIAHDTKCSFFVIHHKNKAGKDDAKTGFRGAGAFKGVPDLVIEIHRKKGSNIL